MTRPACPRLTNGLSAVKGHCPACDHTLSERPVDLGAHNVSYVMDYSGLTGVMFCQSGDAWLAEPPAEDTPISDIDRIVSEHSETCDCERCRAELAA